MWSRLGIAAVVVSMAVPAFGQEPQIDCNNPATQLDMNMCANEDYDAADAELNAQYRVTRQTLAELDAGLDVSLKGAEDALVRAQRAWISYRDAHCEAAGFEARGGSMEPMIVAGCLAEVTRNRTKELKQLVGDDGE